MRDVQSFDNGSWLAVMALWVALPLAAWGLNLLGRRLKAQERALAAERAEREAAERERLIAQERARIARDIHDDLGAALTEIALLADVDTNGVSEASTGTDLRIIAGRARSALLSLEEIVWAVEPGNDNLRRLADYLCSLAEGCFDAAGVRCRREVPTDLPEVEVRADVRHNIAMAVKEALVNAVKHAGAKEVRLGLTWEPPLLRIEVEDDGVGIDMNAAPRAGHGLRNQRERMAAVFGKAEVGPGSRGGTLAAFDVTLDVPEGDGP